MKKLLVVVVLLLTMIISYINADYIGRFVVLHSTTLSKTVQVKEMMVEEVAGDIASLKDENGELFDIIDNRFHEGDEVEVGIDTMGTTTPEDDVIVWTIKK